MQSIGRVIGVRPSAPDVVIAPSRPAPDSTGRQMSIMDSSRVAQCQTCLDVGFYRIEGLSVGDPRFGRAQSCPDCNGGRMIAPISDLLKAARVPEAKWGLTLARWRSAFPERPAYASALEQFAAAGASRSGHRGLYIHGGTGNGKTGAAVGILADLLPRAAGSARYLVWADFLDSIRKTWGTGADMTVAEAIAEVNRANVLIVDEFGGSGRGSGDPTWRGDVARRLTDVRHDGAASGKITIYTSQLDLAAVAREFGGEPIGAAIASRITGHCTIVELSGHDARAD